MFEIKSLKKFEIKRLESRYLNAIQDLNSILAQ